MIKLSTGQDSTLGAYLDMSELFFGENSRQVRFLKEQIEKDPDGRDGEVIAAESQMLFLLANLPPDDAKFVEQVLL